MKASEIKIGHTYLVRVGVRLERVLILSQSIIDGSWGGRRLDYHNWPIQIKNPARVDKCG